MTRLTMLHANVCADRYDYLHTWPDRRPTFLRLMNAQQPELATLVECQAPAARVLGQALGMEALSFGGSSILLDRDVLRFTRTLDTRYWLNSKQSQSVLAVELEVKATGQLVNVLASHLPPFATRAKLRRTQQGQIDALVKRWSDPTILGTDANWTKTYEAATHPAGWRSARLTAVARHHAEVGTGKGYKIGRPIDYVLGRGAVRFGSYDVLDMARFDHNAIKVGVWL